MNYHDSFQIWFDVIFVTFIAWVGYNKTSRLILNTVTECIDSSLPFLLGQSCLSTNNCMLLLSFNQTDIGHSHVLIKLNLQTNENNTFCTETTKRTQFPVRQSNHSDSLTVQSGIPGSTNAVDALQTRHYLWPTYIATSGRWGVWWWGLYDVCFVSWYPAGKREAGAADVWWNHWARKLIEWKRQDPEKQYTLPSVATATYSAASSNNTVTSSLLLPQRLADIWICLVGQRPFRTFAELTYSPSYRVGIHP